MKLLLIAAVVFVAVAGEESEVLKDYSARQVQFTAKIYQELIKSKANNFVVSPVSVNVILALVHNGAKGRTAEQLATGLNLPNNKEEIQQIFREVIPHLQGNKQYNLTSANKVYINEGFEIADEFKNTAVNVFDSDIQTVDFEKNEQAAVEINKWVEDKTNDKIHDLVKKDSLDEYTRAVLINTLYFEGKWVDDFNARATKARPFHLYNKTTVDVPMMEQTSYFNYYESSELGAKFLQMPYRGDDVSLTIVLPNELEGLPSLEARVADLLIAPKYSTERVHVVLPKIKTEASVEFRPILQSLGVIDAFEDFADFSGIGAQPTILKISKVTQKAFIEVEEEGTTAAAATSVIVELGRSAHVLEETPKEFIADHPFIYYLSSPAGILFVGRHIQG